MRKILFFCLAAAILSVIAAFASRKNTSFDHALLSRYLYDAFSAENESDFYASIEKLENEICYANAKTTEKYRLSAILCFVKNNYCNATAENIRTEVRGIFGSCRTVSEDEFYADVTRIYNVYLAKKEGDLVKKTDLPENRIFHVAEKKTGGGAFSSAASEIRKISPFLSAVVYEGFGEKYSVSPDGTVWLYGGNSVFSLGESSRPMLLVIASKGGGDFLRLHSFRNKCVFTRKDVVLDGNIIKTNGFCESFITVSNDPFSGFITYDFSAYKFPR